MKSPAEKSDLSNNEHTDAVFLSLKYQMNHSDMITRWQITLMSYFYHPCGKLSHEVIVAKSCSQEQIKIGEMWTKWLTNFVICDLSCARESICFVWWFILQRIPKEFKKSHGVLVSLQPSQSTTALAFDLHPTQFTAGYLVQQRIMKYHGAKLLFDCRSYFFH